MIPATVPIKDALRGFRLGLHRGRDAMVPLGEGMPGPMRKALGQIVNRADAIGARLESAGSALVQTLLDLQPGATTLRGLADDPEGAARFAQTLYRHLNLALARTGGPSMAISELIAARDFARALEKMTDPADDAGLAAALFLQLDAGLLDVTLPFAVTACETDRPSSRIAVFAVLLWLLADRDGVTDEGDLFGVACDAASSHARRSLRLPRERAALRELFATYAALI